MKFPYRVYPKYNMDSNITWHKEVMHYPEEWFEWKNEKSIRHEPQWIENFEFSGRIKVLDTERGRSAAYFKAVILNVTWNNDLVDFSDIIELLEGCEVSIFITDMLDIINNSHICDGILGSDVVRGIITDNFTFQKRGQNYGLRRVKR